MQVVSVGFAPVKGVRHVAREVVEVARDGVVGDRALCLVDVGARRVLRTVAHPSLMAVQVRAEAGALEVVLPDGRVAAGVPEPTGERVTCDYWGRPVDLALLGGPHGALLSSYVGRPVRLAAAAPGAVVYGAPVTLVATATIDALARRLDLPALDPARFRASAVLATDQPFAEDAWVGGTLAVGDVRLRVTGLVPRCAVVDHHPVTGVRDAAVLRALADLRDGSGLTMGVEAHVEHPGPLHRRAVTFEPPTGQV